MDSVDSQLLRAVRARAPIDAADLLAGQPAEKVASVLEALPRPLAERVAAHLPDGIRPAQLESAAQAVQTDTVADFTESITGALPPTMKAREAIEWLRTSEQAHDLTYLYVVGDESRLLGLVVMRDLLLADAADALSDVMQPSPFALRLDQPFDMAAKATVVRHYPVYPVVDAAGRFHGIVRGYRLFEQRAIEISAQSGQLVGVDKEERVYTPAWEAFKQRHPWLQLNLLTAFGTALVVSLFDATIEKVVVLAAFLPVLSCLAGNNGCQAMAITLRGLTLGDLPRHRIGSVIGKEVLLGAGNGFLTGIMAAVAIYVFALVMEQSNPALLAVIMLVSMTVVCIFSCLLGTLAPVTLKRLGADPATASSIFLLTITDIVGMAFMLFLATTFLV